MNFALDIIEDTKAFQRLEREWWELWRKADATPFRTPAWLLPWWDVFAPGALHVFTLRTNGRLCALAPFYLDDDRYARPVGVSVSDYLNVLVDPAFSGPALDRLADALTAGLRRGITCFELPDVRPGAAALDLFVEAEMARGAQSACPVLLPREDTSSLFDAIPSRKRRKLRMAAHRAERAGGGAITRVCGADVLPAFETLARLHALRWADEGGGVMDDERILQFHRAVLPRLDHAGLLDLFTLEIGGETAGVYYGLRDGRRAFAYLGGYDPRFGPFSPGSQLMAHAIQAADAAGLREFHFLRGAESYKYEWGAVDRLNTRLLFTPSRATADA